MNSPRSSPGTPYFIEAARAPQRILEIVSATRDINNFACFSKVGCTSWREKYARNELRNEAAKKGGNVVTLDSGTNTNGKVDLVGQAYKCPQ